MLDDDLVEVAQLDSENVSNWVILHFKEHLQSCRGFQYVARLTTNHKLCGFICGNLILDEAEIHNIAVAKQYREQGVGAALMEQTLQFLKAQKARACFLEFRVSNQPAKYLYGRFNFQPIAVRKKYYNSPTEDAMIMKLHTI